MTAGPASVSYSDSAAGTYQRLRLIPPARSASANCGEPPTAGRSAVAFTSASRTSSTALLLVSVVSLMFGFSWLRV